MRVAGIANCWEWGAVGAVLVRRAPREQELGRVGQKKALGLHSSVEGGLGSQRARQPHFSPLLTCFSLVLLSLCSISPGLRQSNALFQSRLGRVLEI